MISGFILGFNDQFVFMLIAVIMNSEFGELNAAKYMSWAYIGYAICPLLWPQLMILLINPNNTPPDTPFIEEEQTVLYFGVSVVQNISKFLYFQLTIAIVLLLPLILLMKEPNDLKGKFPEFINYLFFCKHEQAISITRESRANINSKYRKSIVHSLTKIPKALRSHFRTHLGWKTKKEKLKDEVHKTELKRHLLSKSIAKGPASIFSPRLSNPKQSAQNKSCIALDQFVSEDDASGRLKTNEFQSVDKEEEHNNNNKEFVKTTLLSFEFQLIFFLGIIRVVTHRYFTASFKLIGLHYFPSDLLINLIGSVGYIAYVAEGVTFGSILKILGLNNCYRVFFSVNAVSGFIYCLFPTNLFLFVMLTIISRFSQGFNSMLSLSTIFGKYGKDDGLLIYKYFDISGIIAGYLSVKIISIFGNDYQNLVGVVSGLNFLGFAISQFLSLEKKPKENELAQELI